MDIFHPEQVGLSRKQYSLYRGLAVPFAVFTLVALAALASYISYWSQQDALRQLEQMARTNATFLEELQLPRSPSMAEKLATVLGVRVAFYEPRSGSAVFAGDPFGEDFIAVLDEHLRSGKSRFRFLGHDVALATSEPSRTVLILAQESKSPLSRGLGDAILAPAIILMLSCLGLAYGLARRIVNPLKTLTHWLPKLERDQLSTPPVPTEVAARGDELGELARALGETHRRLVEEQARRQKAERMATLGRIATSLAHEIRNPAASIRLHADLLAQGSNPAKTDSLQLIRSEVDRINDLVNQWLFVVRPAPPQTKEHDLDALTDGIAKSLSANLHHAGVTLTMRPPPAPLLVRCDHARIEQVVRNLLVNATQAMPEGGSIQLSFESHEGRASLIIEDSGPGFSERALRQFGEAFFSEREGGMGIGLTLAREVLEAHGGAIEASNAPQGGACVRISLPHHTSR